MCVQQTAHIVNSLTMVKAATSVRPRRDTQPAVVYRREDSPDPPFARRTSSGASGRDAFTSRWSDRLHARAMRHPALTIGQTLDCPIRRGRPGEHDKRGRRLRPIQSGLSRDVRQGCTSVGNRASLPGYADRPGRVPVEPVVPLALERPCTEFTPPAPSATGSRGRTVPSAPSPTHHARPSIPRPW